MLDGTKVGNLLLRRELHFFALITSEGLVYFMKQSSSKHEIKALHRYIEETCCPPNKTNPKKLRTLTQTHHQLNITPHLGPHPAQQPLPKTNPMAAAEVIQLQHLMIFCKCVPQWQLAKGPVCAIAEAAVNSLPCDDASLWQDVPGSHTPSLAG